MSLEIIFGSMYSGKSSNLIAKITRAADVGLKTLYINHNKDIRITESSDSVVSTHNSGFQKLSKKVKGIKIEKLSDVDVSDYDVIGIDEGQFFVGIVSIIRQWVLELNKRVIIASLDSDFMLRPFGEVHLLIGLCEPGHINKLYAICKKCDPNDLKEAGYTLKTSEDNSIIDPGGVDKYLPVCMKCYKKYNKHF